INYWNKQEEEHNDKSIDVVHDHINFNTTSTSATYTLSLHDALPIYHLDARLSRVDGGAEKESGDTSPAQRWVALAGTLRDWARSVPHEFQLIYGTPLPDYVAPPETVPAAAAVAAHFLEVGAAAEVTGFDDATLTGQMMVLVDDGMAAHASGAAAVLAELAALVGFVTLELGGHLVGSADPGDPLFDALVRRQTGTLGLS